MVLLVVGGKVPTLLRERERERERSCEEEKQEGGKNPFLWVFRLSPALVLVDCCLKDQVVTLLMRYVRILKDVVDGSEC